MWDAGWRYWRVHTVGVVAYSLGLQQKIINLRTLSSPSSEKVQALLPFGQLASGKDQQRNHESLHQTLLYWLWEWRPHVFLVELRSHQRQPTVRTSICTHSTHLEEQLHIGCEEFDPSGERRSIGGYCRGEQSICTCLWKWQPSRWVEWEV